MYRDRIAREPRRAHSLCLSAASSRLRRVTLTLARDSRAEEACDGDEAVLAQVEVDDDGDEHIDRYPVDTTGFETPLSNSLNRLRVESTGVE